MTCQLLYAVFSDDTTDHHPVQPSLLTASFVTGTHITLHRRAMAHEVTRARTSKAFRRATIGKLGVRWLIEASCESDISSLYNGIDGLKPLWQVTQRRVHTSTAYALNIAWIYQVFLHKNSSLARLNDDMTRFGGEKRFSFLIEYSKWLNTLICYRRGWSIL